MDAVFSCFVRSGGHNAAPIIRQSAYYDWLASKARIVELFHRGIESVNVRMDEAWHIGTLGKVYSELRKRQPIPGAKKGPAIRPL
jgi:hypothetical protein